MSMQKCVIGITLTCSLVMGASVKAPPLKAIGKIEGNFPTFYNSKITPADSIAPTPDIRSVLGTPGKNIAVRGDTVVVIFGPPSGISDNIFAGVKVGYSFDEGHTWSFFDLSTSTVRRIYPGVIWPENWDSPLFFWHEARFEGGVYLPSPVYIAWDLYFPYGVFNVLELPNSSNWNVWLPSADASGDTIIVTGVNIFSTYFSYIWRSYDHGESWDADTFLTYGAAGSWHDTPIPRIGHNGYIAFITDWIVDYGWEAITPFFLESMDGGQTWSDPLNLWDACGWTPYDSAGGWWYVYDFVLDNSDKPHIAWKFGAGTLEYGDAWYFRPLSGQPGSWSNWEIQLIDGDGTGGTYVTQPTISFDSQNEVLYYTLKGWFISDTDTLPHIELLYSPDLGDNWYEYDSGTWGDPDAVEEEAFELPVSVSSSVNPTGLHGCFLDNATFYFMHAGPLPIIVTIQCGDINGDGNVTQVDLVYLSQYLFASGPPPPSMWASDVNGDGSVSQTDLVYLAQYFFGSGPPPNCP